MRYPNAAKIGLVRGKFPTPGYTLISFDFSCFVIVLNDSFLIVGNPVPNYLVVSSGLMFFHFEEYTVFLALFAFWHKHSSS